MTEQEEARLTLAAQKAASQLPPMSPETAQRIAAILAPAIREQQEQQPGAA